MKATFKITAILIFVLAIGVGKTVIAVEKSKKYNKSWSVSEIETLDVSNKFGEILFKDEGGSEITVSVKVTVEASNEEKANKYFEKIDVEISGSSSLVSVITNFDDNLFKQSVFR